MTKSASKHITALPEEKTGSRGITSLPGPLPTAAPPPPPRAPQPSSVPVGYRIALWVWVGGFILLALQLISEPLQKLLHLVGLFR